MTARIDRWNLTITDWERIAKLPRSYLPIGLNPTCGPRALWVYRHRNRLVTR